MPKLAEPVLTQPPPLVQFINTLPSPLTTALVSLGPSLTRLRRALQIVSWKAAWEESWIAIAAWWAICLFLQPALRWYLPVVVLSVTVARARYSRPTAVPPLVTEDSLQAAVSDLITIRTLTPSLPSPSNSLPLLVLLRGIGILYVPYLILTYVVPMRILFAIAGTLVLAHRSRWATVLRRILWRSAYVRWTVYRAWSLLSGLPPPVAPPPASSTLAAVSTSDKAETQLRFLFTVYENQRWWMGLDWTAALLPGERPAWCSAAQQPVAPPSAFALPAPTTVYTRDALGVGRVRRTARWTWAEPEWRVAVRRENGLHARVERPLPQPKEEGAGAAAILRAAGRMREGSIGGGGSPERHKRGDSVTVGGGAPAGAHDPGEEEELHTDEDGWVYADNKWEGGSAKGGMGKYTRYRRWTRIAVLTETVEPAEPGEVGIHIDEKPDTILSSPIVTSPTSVNSEDSHSAADVHDDEDRSRLRRRLQAAVMSATLP